MSTNHLEKFEKICKQISLNLSPSSKWRWDSEFNLASVVFDHEDADLIYFPLSDEFDKKWDYLTIESSSQPINDYINSIFGLVPGQKIFTSTEDSGLTLFAAWWPWGDESKISLRVGMLPLKGQVLDQNEIKKLLTDWFNI
ncbi:MAG: hypothetical protein JW786_13110 [Desulfobacterales bacterium]|nr:hypothetical protein [Desulfobacterales bacterium]